MSNPMHHGAKGKRPARPLTPSPEAWGSPLNTSPQPTRLQRANAIRHINIKTVRQRQDELAKARSPTRAPRSPRKFSFADITTRYQQDMDVNVHPNIRSHVNPNYGGNANANSNGNSAWHNFVDDHVRQEGHKTWTFEEMRRFPDTLTWFVKQGMPADELGRYLCLFVYGKDKFLGEMVTNPVNANVTYEQIAIRVLMTFDLRDDDGNMVYLQLCPAENPLCKPSRPLRYQVNREVRPREASIPYSQMPPLNQEVLTCEHPNTTGPLLVCPRVQVGRPAALHHRAVKHFFIETESPEVLRALQAQQVPQAQTANTQMNMDEDQFYNDKDMDVEDDDVCMLDPYEDEDYFDSSSEGYSDMVADYFNQHPEIQQAQEIQYTKPTSPPRFYSEINAEKRRQAASRSGEVPSPDASHGSLDVRGSRSNRQATRPFDVRYSFF